MKSTIIFCMGLLFGAVIHHYAAPAVPDRLELRAQPGMGAYITRTTAAGYVEVISLADLLPVTQAK